MNTIGDAKEYIEFGNDVINLLDIKKGMTVLDLGCGNGAWAHKLSTFDTSVIGIDASQELISIAKNQYPEIVFYQKDVTNFNIDEKVDAVFSNAVFHFIDKKFQPDMLNCIYSALKNNGQFVFEFGGYGNNSLIHHALKVSFEKRGYSYCNPFYFPKMEEYITLLERVGFKVMYATVFDQMEPLEGSDGLENWIEMFIKEPFHQIDKEEKKKIIKEAVDSLKMLLNQEDKWYADYVCLRCKAIKI